MEREGAGEAEGEEAAEGEGSPAASCEPAPPGPLDGVGDAESMAGTYRLALVASRGRAAGATAQETLRLRPQDPALRELLGAGGEVMPGALQVLVGALSGDFAAAGAQVPGDPASEDPRAPGVSVLAMTMAPPAPGAAPGPEQILLRLGSEANVRGRVAFDDTYAVLRVARVDDAGFFGSWESGGGGPEEAAGGHFCALRLR